MELKELNQLIDNAIKNAVERPDAMATTNALNAVYANGAIHAYLDLIWKIHGAEAFVEAADRVRDARETLLKRSEKLYTRA